MAYRKVNKTKKYQGIFAYYKNSDKQKITKGYYLRHRDELGKSAMTKLEAGTKEDALTQANIIREDVRKKKASIGQDTEKIERAKRNKTLTLTQLEQIYYEASTTKDKERDHKIYINRVQEHLGNKLIAKITTKDIISLPTTYSKDDTIKTYSPKTINITVDLISAIFNFAVMHKYIESNPVSRNRKHPNIIPRKEVSTETGRVLSDDELDLLFATLREGNDNFKPHPRLYLFCKLLYYTGARPDAILTLKTRDLNQHKQTIRIKAMKQA